MVKLFQSLQRRRDTADPVNDIFQSTKVPKKRIKAFLKELDVNGNLSSNHRQRRSRKRTYDKLLPSQKDKIRCAVHNLMKAVIDKKEEAEYPNSGLHSFQGEWNWRPTEISPLYHVEDS